MLSSFTQPIEPYQPFRVFAHVPISMPDWNRERLSEASAHLNNIPLQDMDRWVNRSTQERRREVARKGKVIHPMNCFMLYRSAYSERVRVLLGASEPTSISEVSISRVTGASWKNETSHIRQKYKALAKIERQNHETALSGYRSNFRRSQAAVRNGNKPELPINLHGRFVRPNDGDIHLNPESISNQISLAVQVGNGFSDSRGTSQAEFLLPGPKIKHNQQERNDGLFTNLPSHDTIKPALNSMSREEIIPTYPQSPRCSLAQPQWHLMQSSPSTSHGVPSIEKMKSYRGDEMEHLMESIIQKQPEMTLLEDFDPIMPNIFSDIVQSQSPKSNLGGFLDTTFDPFNVEEDPERPEIETESPKPQFGYSTHADNATPVIEERPFRCDEPGCNWQFKRRGHLKRHLNIHKGTSFFCWIPGCNRSFTRNDNLRAHIKRHMKKSGRTFYVPELGKDSSVFESVFDDW